MDVFTDDSKSALEAISEAQRIAFAPVAFQIARILRDRGVLEALRVAGHQGLDEAALAQQLDISPYAQTVLVEGGLAAGLIVRAEQQYCLSKTGFFLLTDEMTRVNMDFVQDVCYKGLFHLEEALDTGTPAGLHELGEWPTIYQGLSQLPEKVKKSWFAFDHYYSDTAFPDALPLVLNSKPKKLLDIGGNTGQGSLFCFTHDDDVQVTIADLPGQLAVAEQRIKDAGFSDRFTGHEIDLLDTAQSLPVDFDAIWMSQFLCCFTEDEVHTILQRVVESMGDDGRVYVLDTCWDRQKFEAASYAVIMTSPYFTALANGNSRMYTAEKFLQFFERVGLVVEAEHDGLGLSHTLFVCKKA